MSAEARRPFDAQALPRAIVDDVEQAELPPIAKAVVHEVQGPALIRTTARQPRGAGHRPGRRAPHSALSREAGDGLAFSTLQLSCGETSIVMRFLVRLFAGPAYKRGNRRFPEVKKYLA